MPLTNTEICRSKPAPKPYKFADSGGLHLLVTPAGGRLWRWKYRLDGTEKQLALGQYPDVPLALARERHAEARKLLAAGVGANGATEGRKNCAYGNSGEFFFDRRKTLVETLARGQKPAPCRYDMAAD
jgi:hypothetical protein